MSTTRKNIDILEHIVNYCKRIEEIQEYFGNSFEVFKSNFIYRDAVAMSLLQIGELTGHLSDSFKERYNGVPWKNIKGLRNVVAHNYGEINVETVWGTINSRVPELYTYCNEIIENHRVLEQDSIENEDEYER